MMQSQAPSNLKIKFKKLIPDAKIPLRATAGDLGFDLFAVESIPVQAGSTVAIKTGIAAEFPEGWGGIIKARSSQGKIGLDVYAGVVDSGYRGEIIVLVHNSNDPRSEAHEFYKAGEKIAQLVLVPVFPGTAEESDVLEGSARGTSGFGSTGR